MAQGFLARVAGKTRQIFATVVSLGAASAGDVVGLGADGRLDASVLPAGIGANVVQAVASEAIGAGKFVELFDDAGVLKMRLADNSNGRPAWGYVKGAVALAASGAAYRLNTVNANLSGLTAGADYWLGTAGGVVDTPLDPAVDIGELDQYLGRASSATELVTVEHAPVYL
jgi:hypothetical protein